VLSRIINYILIINNNSNTAYCNSDVSNLTITSNSSSFGYATFTWTGTGNPDHYILDGYYQGIGDRFAVTVVCSAEPTGSSQNITFRPVSVLFMKNSSITK
jgi:hypothetical protein